MLHFEGPGREARRASVSQERASERTRGRGDMGRGEEGEEEQEEKEEEERRSTNYLVGSASLLSCFPANQACASWFSYFLELTSESI